ncbi:Formin-2 [Durusdinium trenchii]|uniref:Formin-2 n=1 Tax=Durusdinium trenchii TaxID=1381693 RepID=A0ABP0SNH9_9DINO
MAVCSLRKSSDFILLWDNLLIPEDLMLAIPLSTLKKYIFPRFCAPSVIPNLHDLLLLWGFRAAEQQLGRCVFRETASNRRCVQGEKGHV